MRRKAVVATALAATLAGGGVAAAELIGPAYAQDAGGSARTETQPDGAQGPEQHIAETLKPLVDNGTITQEQADAVSQALAAARPPARGPDGHGGPGGRGPRLAAAATALGMDESALRDELRAGKSLANVASEHGVDVQAVIDAMVAEAEARLAQAVTDGKLTQEQADQKKADLSQRITDMVNGELPPRTRGGPNGESSSGDGSSTS